MVTGKMSSFIFLVAVVALILYMMQRAKAGHLPKVRPIAGLEAMEEAVGRATELGTPVFYVPGRTEINTAGAAQTIAGLEILGHVAELTAKYDAPLRTAIAAPNVYPMAEEIVRQAYSRAGHPEKFVPEAVQFLSSEQFAFAAACLDMMHRDKVASAMLIGEFQAESLMLAEGAAQAGAIVIAGTSRTFQIPFFVAAADYTLIGEEMFAGGAYLTKNPLKLASIAAQDYGKLIALVLMLGGAILMTLGNPAVLDFLKK